MVPDIDLRDARWFPVDLDVQGRRFALLALNEAVLESSSFLDTRMDAPLATATPIPVAAADEVAISPRTAWLFHTSFCGSTLLARVLHAPPATVCLREPMVLRRLGDARHARIDIGPVLRPTIALLSRPWHEHGHVVIKPTHAALNVATDLLASTPGSRAIVLTSSLDDFLVSNLKKTADSQAKIPQLAERAVQASGFHRALPPGAFSPPSLLGAAVIQWAAQRELLRQIVEAAGLERVRVMDMSALLDDLPSAVRAAVDWMRLPISEAALRERCDREGSRNAKATEASYSAAQRAEESRYLQRTFAPLIAEAKDWAASQVLPYLPPHAADVAASWTLK